MKNTRRWPLTLVYAVLELTHIIKIGICKNAKFLGRKYMRELEIKLVKNH